MDKIVRNPRLGESTTGADLGQINGCMFSLLDEMHAVHFYVECLSAVVVVPPTPTPVLSVRCQDCVAAAKAAGVRRWVICLA